MDQRHHAFLSGKRPDDVLIYLSDAAVSDGEALAEHGTRVDGGTVLVLPGDQGRSVFEQAVGVPPMTFAGTAMETDGTVRNDCTGGECPNADPETEHRVRVLLAFAEEQNEDAGGLYAEGDVIHAYAGCTCDATYSDRWVVEQSES
ncbi:DUF5807 family protein [Halocatena pleomorpha]|uniref:Uncharacterized protein n=1 Tax=Halocatena pleomorpha TaxID=1785090 RepID=A0A3P3R713_9EURY|nr:DUF5807 family protein [Halocatena pleomorpha]RRJ28420.1 hypothetical protein EIK79_15710 [Halocatena pleomorpha]